jgi:hypothetical protein
MIEEHTETHINDSQCQNSTNHELNNAFMLDSKLSETTQELVPDDNSKKTEKMSKYTCKRPRIRFIISSEKTNQTNTSEEDTNMKVNIESQDGKDNLPLKKYFLRKRKDNETYDDKKDSVSVELSQIVIKEYPLSLEKKIKPQNVTDFIPYLTEIMEARKELKELEGK